MNEKFGKRFETNLLDLKLDITKDVDNKLDKKIQETENNFQKFKSEINDFCVNKLKDCKNNEFINKFIMEIKKDFENYKIELNADIETIKTDLKQNFETNTLEQSLFDLDKINNEINSKIDLKWNQCVDSILSNFDKFKLEINESICLNIELLKKQFINLETCLNDQIESIENIINDKIKMHVDVFKNDLIIFEENFEKIDEWKKTFEEKQFESWKLLRQEFISKINGLEIQTNLHSENLIEFENNIKIANETMEKWKNEFKLLFNNKWDTCQSIISNHITDIDKKLHSFENRILTVEQMCEDLRKEIMKQEFKIEENLIRIKNGSIYIGDVELSDKNHLVTKIANIYSNNVPVVDSPMMVMCDNKGQLGTNFSSIVYKENVDNIGELSKMIYRLRPVSFTYKTDENKNLQYGLIGEEVEKVSPELVCYNKEDNIIGVAYHKLIPLMINEMKSMKKELDALKLKMN